ncbi:Stk1 family PASTA domain-containing Ser/Thr kinase [Chloroflexus sp.]|uniref:Stk1 family PASTA domain-containing Ser/Thr kinase n=1 Tax=Chloroflexus sp. TaxID=1904827 RepID=UPI00298F35CF|nr:Stk1 family PASTA domain-containing Ser/Thr kinase [Chloroflexus sp.]MCS6889626.1 Stk1 family PASTA domain-containing Ser/Thr kinase [Chloroflexus sp.]MDW8402656.1 Stk1 family PASTA domain-containing Ser/Thr kinase [Chloroflexus sp.]
MQPQLLDGRYQVERLLGDGGMARVYLGRDLRLNRPVAIKIPHSHLMTDPDFLARFRHEAHAAAMVSHPNLVDVYDVGQDGDLHYIVMEYVAGSTLKQLINREAPFAIPRAVRIGEQIARGLHAAHRAGLIHRDIKPQNIIVTDDGQARITDFGVAKSHLSTAMTETGITLGTVDYIAPEQAQGRPATPQSDIYALGVVLYEMLTGRLPFTGDTPVAVAMKHISEPPPPPRRYNPQIPSALEAIILRALAKDPAQRQRSALELAEELRSYEQLVTQATVVNPGIEPLAQVRPAPSPRPAQVTASRPAAIPSPRPATTRVPRQEGVGCGVFLVGMLTLAGVLAVVFVVSSGMLNNLFSNPSRPPTTQPANGQSQSTEVTPSPTVVATTIVPELVGRSDGEARQLLQQNQLIPVPSSEHNRNVPQGIVMTQAIPAGTVVEVNSPVSYTVSLGPLLVEVPNVTGTRQDIARNQLVAAGLKVNVVEEPSQTVDEGFVIRQSPSATLRIPQDDIVTIYVSLGDVIRFPEVIGRSRAEAEAILANTPGLTLVFVDVQGRDRLPDFDRYAPNEVVSAARVIGNNQVIGINNNDYIPRGSSIVLGVRAEE